MFQTYINGGSSPIQVEPTPDGSWLVQGHRLELDIVSEGSNRFHALLQGKSYNIEVLKIDTANKQVSLRINQCQLEVKLKDKFDVLLEKMGMNVNATAKSEHIYAPMPGKIIQIHAEVGKTLQPGEPLLILEAMKMENVIKATQSATIKSVKIKVGDTVEKKQLLIEMA